MSRRAYLPLLCLTIVACVQAAPRAASAVDGYVLSDDGYVASGGIVASGVVSDGVEVFDGGFVGACRPWQYGSPDLFYNFFTQGNCNAANAQLYMSPHEVPPLVGHTYYTYQPFYPHEYLYKHDRSYHRYYDGGRGLNRTHVKWSYPPVKTTAQTFYNYIRIAR